MDPTAYSTCLFLGKSYAFSTSLESKNCKELGHYFFTVALDVQCIERKNIPSKQVHHIQQKLFGTTHKNIHIHIIYCM